ncbi:MAG: HEAT repeat domain-containing protein [Myxococcales bacterium]|nr:HEAT repeat domain-containing protein [Myxococcales bacterium]
MAARRELILRAASEAGPETVSWLAELAASGDELAAIAAQALGSVKSPSAASALLAIATARGPVITRANAARALGAAGGAAEIPALAALAANGREAVRVRQEAALALGSIGDDGIVPVLASALEAAANDGGSEAEQLRISLVQALGGIDSPSAQEVLAAHAGRDLSPTERAFVARARDSQGGGIEAHRAVP